MLLHRTNNLPKTAAAVTTFLLASSQSSLLLLSSSITIAAALSTPNKAVTTTMPRRTNTIDSHLHIWASSSQSITYPYSSGQQPPPSLQNEADVASLLHQMEQAGVDGALIVQPINHQYDHTYVSEAIKEYPHKFKGMMLHDPSLSVELAVNRLEELVLLGFVGVRYNPYLWEDDMKMSSCQAGLAVYKRCGELGIPVGIMCFKGLDLHYGDIIALLQSSPNTVCILDHMGFCALNTKGDEQFEQLLSLAKYDNVYVKISALFRNVGDGSSDVKFPYDAIKTKRFVPLLKHYGADRLMMGTDFPFVLETEGGYRGAVETVKSWTEEGAERDAVMGGTAERLFGKWV